MTWECAAATSNLGCEVASCKCFWQKPIFVLPHNFTYVCIKGAVLVAIYCDHQKMKVASWNCRGHSACGVSSLSSQNRLQVMLWISNAQIFKLYGVWFFLTFKAWIQAWRTGMFILLFKTPVSIGWASTKSRAWISFFHTFYPRIFYLWAPPSGWRLVVCRADRQDWKWYGQNQWCQGCFC